MQEYIDALKEIYHMGESKRDYNNESTLSKFATTIRLNLYGNKIPLLSTKHISHADLTHEMIWFLSGSTNIRYLKKHDVDMWDDKVGDGDVGYEHMSDKELIKTIALCRGLGDTTGEWSSSELVNRINIHLVDGSIAQVRGNTIQEAYAKLTKREPMKMISGSIGDKGPGKMWRDVDDVRIIGPKDLEHYESNGYEFVGETPRGIVVSRKIDQISNIVRLLRTDPNSKHMLVNSFDHRVSDYVMSSPKHFTWGVWTRELTTDEREELSRLKKEEVNYIGNITDKWMSDHNIPKLAMRIFVFAHSQDVPVDVPYILAQYALLGHMLAHVTGMVCEELVWVGMDAYIHSDQTVGVMEQCNRELMHNNVTVAFNSEVTEIDDITFDDITIEGYENYHPHID